MTTSRSRKMIVQRKKRKKKNIKYSVTISRTSLSELIPEHHGVRFRVFDTDTDGGKFRPGRTWWLPPKHLRAPVLTVNRRGPLSRSNDPNNLPQPFVPPAALSIGGFFFVHFKMFTGSKSVRTRSALHEQDRETRKYRKYNSRVMTESY